MIVFPVFCATGLAWLVFSWWWEKSALRSLCGCRPKSVVYAVPSSAAAATPPSGGSSKVSPRSPRSWVLSWGQTLRRLSKALSVCATTILHLIILALWTAYHLQQRGEWVLSAIGLGFLLLDLISLVLLLGVSRIARRNSHTPILIAAVLFALLSMLAWPVVLVFVDTARSTTHIWGVAFWGLACLHDPRWGFVLDALPISQSRTARMIKLCVSVPTTIAAIRLGLWDTMMSPGGPEDWYLMVYLAIPVAYVLLRFKPDCSSSSLNDLSFRSEGVSPSRDTLNASHQSVTLLPPAKSCVADLAHEVRTPLNALLSCCTLLADSNLSPEQLDYINVMMTCGSQITNNINFVLDMAKLEQGKLTLEHKPMDLSQVCEDVLEIVHHLAEQKHLHLDLQYRRMADEGSSGGETPLPRTNSFPIFMGDANRLKQALLNLMTNSIKFTHQGGVTITLLVSSIPLLERKSSSLVLSTAVPPTATTVRVEITDTGIGMSEEQQKRLFQPFEQASSETYGKYGGTGLGLVISKQLIELMHGSIRIDPTRTSPGKGSTFVIELPLTPHVPAFKAPHLASHTPKHINVSLEPSSLPMVASCSDESLMRRRLRNRLQGQNGFSSCASMQDIKLSGNLSPCGSSANLLLSPTSPSQAHSRSLLASTPSDTPMPLIPTLSPPLPPTPPPPPPPAPCDVQILVERSDSTPGVSVAPPKLSLLSFANLPGGTSNLGVPTSQPGSSTSRTRRGSHLTTTTGSGSASSRSSHYGYDETMTNAFDCEQRRLSRVLSHTPGAESLLINALPSHRTPRDPIATARGSADLAPTPSALFQISRPPLIAAASMGMLASSSSFAALPSAMHQLRLLAVDDSDLSNALMFRLLRSIGFETVELASSGEEALELWHQAPVDMKFDVLITDINLGDGINGIQLAAQIRQLAQLLTPRHLPNYRASTSSEKQPMGWPIIIALSGTEDEQLVEQCSEVWLVKGGLGEAGVNAFISKPVTRAHLSETIINLHKN